MYWILFISIALISWAVSALMEHRFKTYSQESIALTGRQVAEKMLRDNGITDVQVTCTSGHLTDHYDPRTKTVNLSESVYNSANVAAAAVAAHECGHALQHAFAYGPLRMRSALVPVVNFASRWVTWVLLGGILLIHSFPQLLTIGVVLYGLTTLFSFITLPVEINASTRAVAWLETAGITDRQTTPMAASALRSAAYTYVVAALASLGTLIYYVMILVGRRD
ncbi:MAG: zinc metallopeptidase [Paludibacteraceae bacterium]|nr:zinc metallopeptidase [Bacteroidales bacterium]MBO4987141.1 zinc metallopeptidase [Paludibacteraceae bacterium]MBO5013818.1 zinc metallopeptidase [Paludibacteraceae bacterium]MBP3576039.1 zinc metallopeptidase [Paludibacteraceae bacterium]MBR2486983.1 zinc metallopeptidase [Paludibacteraceae bacterium]